MTKESAPRGAQGSPEKVSDASDASYLEEDKEKARYPLKEILVFLPEEQIIINGESFDFCVDSERLVRAVNRLESTSPNSTRPVKSLIVKLGESLPAELSPETGKPSEPYNTMTESLIVELPKELHDSNLSVHEIRRRTEKLINRQIETGLLQSFRRSEITAHASRFMKFVGFTLAPFTGAIVGMAEDGQKVYERIIDGGASAGGVALVGLGLAAVSSLGDEKQIVWWAKKKTGADKSWWAKNPIDPYAFSGPIVELIALEEEQRDRT